MVFTVDIVAVVVHVYIPVCLVCKLETNRSSWVIFPFSSESGLELVEVADSKLSLN